ncbi:hypothetical protein RhiirA1_470078 [Rhizophagus irregularis]|uniref:Uncharacterized protein n=1 Tax=Rhizophagus irregularis TaxID=588596 RepID=A0A2N0R6U2_9GLOM|nr:hypothetical protein RhiirA1_470078 [Rhizophagus irregularis]
MILSRDLRKPLYKWNKRKANELDDDYDMDIVWGIVTDAEKWYFMECGQGPWPYYLVVGRGAEAGGNFSGIENEKGKVNRQGNNGNLPSQT